MLLNLPENAWRSIAIHLPPQDILSFLSVHKNINNHLAKSSPSFWKQLLAIHRDEDIDTSSSSSNNDTSPNTATTDIQDARNEFMLQAYKSALPKVKWIPLDINNTFPVSAREGHISCVLNGPDNYKSLVITGGFTDDEGIIVLSLPSGYKSHTKTWGWSRLMPERGCGTSFVYGASLTALPPINNTANNPNVHIAKAVRFGGFAGGGYSQETNEVWVLTIRDEEHSDGMLSQTASWERITTKGMARPRAYHTATLLHDRYLVVIGGMTESGSIIEEAILDTHTWTWIDLTLACKGEPRGRHGHSVVHDTRRDRLVMFGGGSGTDLLRSGSDNNEVWELKMNGIEIPRQLVNDKMWEWHKLHGDDTSSDEDDSSIDDDEEYRGDDSNEEEEEEEADAKEGGGGDDEEDSTSSNDTTVANRLLPTESLCLGRCHNGMKIAPDTVLFMFGSGHPNTNGVLGYNLSTDSFIRPTISGPLPMPRFTGVASFLDIEGYVFVHGGYSTGAGAIKDLFLLDLAPHLNRNFTSLDVDTNRRSNRAVEVESSDRDEIADRIQGGSNAMSRLLMQNLLGMIDAEELQEMIARGGV